MSFGVFLSLTLLSAVLALGQWFFFKLFNHSKLTYVPLFGSLLLTNLAIVFLRGCVR
jgi:hypothetical protein